MKLGLNIAVKIALQLYVTRTMIFHVISSQNVRTSHTLKQDCDSRYVPTKGIMCLSPSRVISIDMPSGVEGDTGHMSGKAIEANMTMAIGFPKLGLIVLPLANK